MHGGCQFFSLTLLVEVDENIFIRWVTLYALVSVWMREEREKHTRASPRLVGCGEMRRWVQAHDVCMNSPPKSGPKPHRSTTSFCHLFLLRVRV